eukprot:1676024-Amphidinium_carterae.1
MEPAKSECAYEAAPGDDERTKKQTWLVETGQSKGHGKGACKRSDSTRGWHCSSCKVYGFGFRPVCFACKQGKGGKRVAAQAKLSDKIDQNQTFARDR